ncbi:MAG: CPBP family intramembrane metalloprotease [Firmicutes bacterium]|nr:CPBP family intramembrane metalloprotease [Bacillota bacterium]
MRTFSSQSNRIRLTDADASAIFVVAFFVALLTTMLISFLPKNFSSPLSYLAPQVCYAVAILFFVRHKKVGFRAVIPYKKPVPLALIFSVFATLGVLFQNLIFGVSFGYIFNHFGVGRTPEVPNVATAIIVCIMPAIGEEFMFRGLFLTVLKEKRGSVYAVLMTSLLFALSHLNAQQFVFQFLFGLVLGFITVKTGNILYSQIMHALSNAFVISLPLIIPFFARIDTFSWYNIGIMAVFAVVGAVVLYPSLAFMVKAVNAVKVKRAVTEEDYLSGVLDLDAHEAQIKDGEIIEGETIETYSEKLKIFGFFTFFKEKDLRICYNQKEQRKASLAFVSLIAGLAFLFVITIFL